MKLIAGILKEKAEKMYDPYHIFDALHDLNEEEFYSYINKIMEAAVCHLRQTDEG